MCNVCVAEQALAGQVEVHGYQLQARGAGAEHEPAEYRLKYAAWPEWPSLWLSTDDLAGTVSSLGLDVQLDAWTDSMFHAFQAAMREFRAALGTHSGFVL